MNKRSLEILMTMTVLAGAAGMARAENAVYACTSDTGVVSYTNHMDNGQCLKLLSGADIAPTAEASAPVGAPADAADQAASAAAPAVAAAASTAQSPIVPPSPQKPRDARAPLVAPQATAPQPRNAREALLAQRRDQVIRQTADAYLTDQPNGGANRAVGRRYLMVNRSTYQQSIAVTP
jgi:hypothetical protein